MEPMIIEAAINELSPRDQNKNVPYSPEEIARDAIACAEAGASVIHFHARDPISGEQRFHDADLYEEAFRLIRGESDVITYPTQPGSGIDKIPHLLELDDRGLKLDMVNIDIYPPALDSPDMALPCRNIEVMREMTKRGVPYAIGVREVGHMKRLGTYRDEGLLGDEVHLRIFLSEGSTWGPTPSARGIYMFLDELPAGMKAHWFVTMFRGKGLDGGSSGAKAESTVFLRMSMLAAAMGGHIRTGIGDHAILGGVRDMTNADCVAAAVELAHLAGREVATPAIAREILAPAWFGHMGSDRRPAGCT